MKRIDFNRFKEGFQDVLSGNIFRRESFKKQYPLAILICILFLLYIHNDYKAQRQQQKLADTNRKIEEARFEYLSVSATLVEQTRQSTVARKLEEQGSRIRTSVTPAIRID